MDKKILSLLLALCVPSAAHAQLLSTAAVDSSTATAVALPPLIITAPTFSDEEQQQILELKTTRAVGGAAALAGIGLMSYAVLFAAAGPIGWAAGLIFFGGMSAYLAHRRLQGKNDFASPAGAAPLQSVSSMTTPTFPTAGSPAPDPLNP
jgi:hypothetical protein